MILPFISFLFHICIICTYHTCWVSLIWEVDSPFHRSNLGLSHVICLVKMQNFTNIFSLIFKMSFFHGKNLPLNSFFNLKFIIYIRDFPGCSQGPIFGPIPNDKIVWFFPKLEGKIPKPFLTIDENFRFFRLF